MRGVILAQQYMHNALYKVLSISGAWLLARIYYSRLDCVSRWYGIVVNN
jgi:hypothetical protein